MSTKRLAVDVLKFGGDGKLEPLREPVYPSMPCAAITITRFEPRNIRLDPKGERPLCDLHIVGSVASPLCDLLPGLDGIIDEGTLTVNGDDKPHSRFPITVSKHEGDPDPEPTAPFPYRGAFDTTVEAVPITDGNNTFEIAAPDRVYGLSGSVMWVAVFAIAYPPEAGELPDPDAPKESKVMEPPKKVRGGATGELHLYGISVTGVDPAEAQDIRVYLGNQKPIACGLIAGPKPDTWLVKRPDAPVPLIFSLRPSSRTHGIEPADPAVSRTLLSRTAELRRSDATNHALGFSTGCFVVGGDVIAGVEEQAICAVSYSFESRSLVLEGHVALGEKPLHDFDASLPADFADVPAPAPDAPLTIPAMLWHFGELHRTKDPRAKEITICLLVGDLTDAGLPVRLEDPRENLFSNLAEVLEELRKLQKDKPPARRGYDVGRGLSEALRITCIPGESLQLQFTPKSEFLGKLAEIRSFGGSKAGGRKMPVPASATPSLMENLKRSLGF